MTSPRGVAAFVFLVGLIAGTLEDTATTGELRPQEEYWMVVFGNTPFRSPRRHDP
jgi:hypothetical protein